MASIARPASKRSSAGYQCLLVGLLSLNFGILFFDRNALNFLMPFVQPDLRLDNGEVGLLASALSLSWATAGLLVGRLSDRMGRRKPILLAASLAFSLCSFVSGLAASFLMLLGARLLMGLAEGGVLPVSQSLIATEVAPQRRGLAMGVMQNLGSNLLGSTAAPLLLVATALRWGWREAFYLAALPGLLTCLAMAWLVREPSEARIGATTARLTLGEALGRRNILICMAIAVLLVSYLVVCWAFMPLFLTRVRGFSPVTMGWLMAVLGISAGFTSFAVPGLSDRIGRRPVMILVPLIGVILPLGALWWQGPVWGLALLFFVGWALTGLFPLFMATIPSETVDARHTATALGLVMGTGEVLGGVIGPALAGAAADRWGLAMPLWMMSGLCVLAGLLAFGLEESAPLAIRAVSESKR